MKRAPLRLVTAIVLTWNSAEFIEHCLDSLLTSTYKTDILVVDNNSADTTRDLVSRKYPRIKLVNTGDNLGYAGGNNYAMRQLLDSDTDYFFILNPDAYVAKDCITLLIKRMEQEQDLAGASPMIYRKQPNVIWYAGSNINWKNGTTPHVGNNQLDTGQFAADTYTGRLNGCAMLLRKTTVKAVGLMDENYFLYYEETDWSVRFMNAGYKLGFVPTAKAWHLAGASTGGFHSPVYEYYMTRNKFYFMHKYRQHASKIYVARVLYKMGYDLLKIHRQFGFRVFQRTARYQFMGMNDYLHRKFNHRNIL